MTLSAVLRNTGLAFILTGSAALVLLPLLVSEAEARPRSGSSSTSHSSGMDLATGLVIGAGAAALMTSGSSKAEGHPGPIEQVTESFVGGEHRISGVKRFKQHTWQRVESYPGVDMFRSCPEEGRLRRYQGEYACRFSDNGRFSREWRHEPLQSIGELLSAQYSADITVETVQVVNGDLFAQFDTLGSHQDTPSPQED